MESIPIATHRATAGLLIDVTLRQSPPALTLLLRTSFSTESEIHSSGGFGSVRRLRSLRRISFSFFVIRSSWNKCCIQEEPLFPIDSFPGLCQNASVDGLDRPRFKTRRPSQPAVKVCLRIPASWSSARKRPATRLVARSSPHAFATGKVSVRLEHRLG